MIKSVVCVVLCISFALAQEGAKLDRWRGLVIDEATPEAAIEALGKPSSDKVDRLRVFDVDSKWISKRIEQKIFRRLEFKADGVDKATLSFLDNKLVMIELDPKDKPDASALARIYGIDFLPRISGFQLAVNPRDYERREGRIYPKIYPSVFSIVAVTDRVFVGVLISNAGFGAALRGSAGIPDAGAMPGKVERIQIISRRLENKDGAEALK
ncbi:MAG: hypothetical protein AB7U82_27585 [Blastocatellales bacterium]